MAQTPTYIVHDGFLPVQWQRLVWTDFNDASLLEVGTILFDHQPYAMYAGEVVGFGHDHLGHMSVRIHWHKAPDNIIGESYTLVQLEHAHLYWADPVMQEV